MDCSRARVAVSARLDGEALGIDGADLDKHLAHCSGCRAFQARALELRRVVRVAVAEPVPDLAPQVLARVGPHPDPPGWFALRWVLLIVGVSQIIAALPALLGSDAGLPIHVARHLGSFDVALAVGFVFAALRPARVAGLLPVVAALVVLLFGTSVFDMITGHTGALNEAQHVPEIAGLAALWLVTRRSVAGHQTVVRA